MTPVHDRLPPSFELVADKKVFSTKSGVNKRSYTYKDSHNYISSPTGSRASSAASSASAGRLVQVRDESAFDNFLALPLPMHEIIFDYTCSGGAPPLMGQMQRGNQIISSYFALKFMQLNIRHKALKSDIKKLDQIILNVSKKTLSLIGINREDHFGELSASSLDSPVKAAKKNSTDLQWNPSSFSPTEGKTTKTLKNKRTRYEANKALEGPITLDTTPKLASSKFALWQQKLEDKEKEIQRLYYTSLFCIRLHCEKSKSIARVLKDYLESNQSDILEAAFSCNEQVFYAAAELCGQGPSTSVYLLSPNGMAKSEPEQFLNAKEDDVIHVVAESGSYVVIPKQKQIAALLNTPTVCPPTLFEKAISGEH